MKQSTRKKAATLAKKWASRIGKGGSFQQQLKDLKKEAGEMDIQVYVGWMSMVGGFETANFVQFNIPTYAYASSWPDWAYQLALQSLLAGKKLLIMSDGEPLGDNLIQVAILHQDID